MQSHAGRIEGVAGREIVAGVDHHVGRGDLLEQCLAFQPLCQRHHARGRVDRLHRTADRVDLQHADALRGVRNLPLQVGQVDPIRVTDHQFADAGTREVERDRRTQPPGPDQQNPAVEQALLAVDPDLVEQDVAAVAGELVVIHRRKGRAGQPRLQRPDQRETAAAEVDATGAAAATGSSRCTGWPFRWLSACISWKSSRENT